MFLVLNTLCFNLLTDLNLQHTFNHYKRIDILYRLYLMLYNDYSYTIYFSLSKKVQGQYPVCEWEFSPSATVGKFHRLSGACGI